MDDAKVLDWKGHRSQLVGAGLAFSDAVGARRAPYTWRFTMGSYVKSQRRRTPANVNAGQTGEVPGF